MTLQHKILVGSSYFFKKGKDKDYVVFEKDTKYQFYKQITNNNEDVFYWNIDNVLNYDFNKNPMAIGKFLVPKIMEALNLNFDDVKDLIKKHIYKVKEKHNYQIAIFEFYLENNKMLLTKTQLKEVEKIYKQ